MTLVDLLERAIKKEITYADALAELRKLKLPIDEEERYELLIQKAIGKTIKPRDYQYFFESIPNKLYREILEETIDHVRRGMFSPEIAQELYNGYMISSPLITYFINEAISIVRLNSLNSEEIASIGEAYHQVATSMEKQGIKNPPQVRMQAKKINAEDVGFIDVENEDDEDE